MPYNVVPVGLENSWEDTLVKSGFAKQCEHGHFMHTPHNTPLPAHTAEYHSSSRNGLGNFIPYATDEHPLVSGLTIPQYHPNDLTARGWSAYKIVTELQIRQGHVSLCPHGAVVDNDRNDCSGIDGHHPARMQGVERNMTAHDLALHRRALLNHHSIYGTTEEEANEENEENNYDDWDSYSENYQEPRTEKELIDQEPERVAGIRQRLGKVLKTAASVEKRSQDYTTRLLKGNERFESRSDLDFNPDWRNHVVAAYHKGSFIGSISYDDNGSVGGMYLDARHIGGPAALLMLAHAHSHLKDLGNPIGLLHSDNTTLDSGGLIKKIDPDSTYLKGPEAMSGRSRNEITPDDAPHGVPAHLSDDIKTIPEWKELSKSTGLNFDELLALSSNRFNRQRSVISKVNDPEIRQIAEAYKSEDKQMLNTRKVEMGRKAQTDLTKRVIDRQISLGFEGDTTGLETSVNDSDLPLSSLRRYGFDYGMQNLRHEIRRVNERNLWGSSFNALIKNPKNLTDSDQEILTQTLNNTVSDDATGVWTGEEPESRSASERAQALLGKRLRPE